MHRHRRRRRGWRHGAGIVQGADGLSQRRHRQHRESADDRRFGRVQAREKDAGEAIAAGGRRNRKNPARGLDRSVQRQLAQHDDVRDIAPLDRALRGEDAEGYRQVEGSAGLAQVGGREIDRNAVRGNSNPELRIALFTRSRLSRTLASGRPTMVNPGMPKDTSTSTCTGAASTPNTEAVRRQASIAVAGASRGRGCVKRLQRLTGVSGEA